MNRPLILRWKNTRRRHFKSLYWRIHDNSWLFKPNDDFRGGYDGLHDDDKFVKAALENIYVKPCRECNDKCFDGVSALILGKEYKKICKHFWIYFSVPNTEAVECAEKIVRIKCAEIAAV